MEQEIFNAFDRAEVDRYIADIKSTSSNDRERLLEAEILTLQNEIHKLKSKTPESIPSELSELLEICLYDFPALPGACVYFLTFEGRVVYVGKSTSLASRIQAHKSERFKVFDQVFYISVDPKDLDSIERKFIKKFLPKYNREGARRFR